MKRLAIVLLATICPGAIFIVSILLASLTGCKTKQSEGSTSNEVKAVGALRDVMQKGELFGKIDLDTINNKNHLYGIGPLEQLKGEILVSDGVAYVATIGSDDAIQLKETYQVSAPFFVYANVEKWKTLFLPDSIQTLNHLEIFLTEVSKKNPLPFTFRIDATLDSVAFHVVNWPEATQIRSSEDARRNQRGFRLANTRAELIGFFSTKHQGVFTHHDSFLHIHLITSDKMMMGHLDEMRLKKGTAKLFVSPNS